MKFSGLTKKGRAYLAKCQAASTPIQFTKMKFGDGKLIDNENPADLTDIKNIKIEKSILSKEQKGDAVVLTTIIDNVSLEQGYFPRETGIYVLDEGVEVLYFYMNDGDETSWIPPEADGPHRMEVKINLISSNTGSVVVHNDGKDLYITKEYLEANYTQKGEYDGTAQSIEDRVVAAVGQLNGMFPLSEAIAGNVYYHQGNKKFYICKSNYNGTTISVPNMNFEDLSIWENRKRLENLITFEDYNALKVKIINVTLTANVVTGDSISVNEIPNGAVFITGFLYNYIKQEKTNIYEYWDLQVSQPNKCIIRKIKNYGFTSYATILVLYKN
ncbi:phage tail protein [Fusobacterium animalis]|uniref:phage tail-collar fiber domain-containing protein n=1 Tax=Fusobacterium animalis TaxID=76859 RepID=UPI00386A6A6D